MEQFRFDSRAVLITGGGRGMGRAHARLLAERGAHVMIADAGVALYGQIGDAEVATEVADELRAEGWSVSSYVDDLAPEFGARNAVRETISQFGRIDMVIHNAGFTLGSLAFEHEDVERFDKQMAINARAGFAMAQEAWSYFQAQRFGRIVFVGSTAMYGLPRSTPYSTAKAAYIGLTRALADEGGGQGIHVNLIAPSGATRMADNMPPSEFRDWFLETMRPELVSPLVAWLCHPHCDVNGEIFVAGGGRFARMLIRETSGLVMPSPSIEGIHAARVSLMSDLAAMPVDTFEASMNLMMDSFGFRPNAPSPGYAGSAPPTADETHKHRRIS